MNKNKMEHRDDFFQTQTNKIAAKKKEMLQKNLKSVEMNKNKIEHRDDFFQTQTNKIGVKKKRNASKKSEIGRNEQK